MREAARTLGAAARRHFRIEAAAQRIADETVLETVARVRKRARHNYAHRVIEVAGLHLVGDRDGLNVGGTAVPRLGIFGVSQNGFSGQISE